MISENGEKKELTKEEAVNALQQDILDSTQELNDLLPELGHGEAKRLLLASISYPLMEEDFSTESEAMIKAFSATKRITDAKVALGVEVTLEAMIKQQFEQELQGEEND